MDRNKNHLPVLPTNNPPSWKFYTVTEKRDTVTRSLRWWCTDSKLNTHRLCMDKGHCKELKAHVQKFSLSVFVRLTIFRWIIPANGEVTLRLRFQSEELGQFDQTLNFEIVGTRRRYQLYCRGICAFPTISREPR
jgi:hypothetical protein